MHCMYIFLFCIPVYIPGDYCVLKYDILSAGKFNNYSLVIGKDELWVVDG